MAFLFDEFGWSEQHAHRSVTRGVPLLLLALGLVLVLFFRTGLDLLLWAVGIMAAALIARGVGDWFADHLGSKGELVVLLVLLGGFWVTISWIEPARRSAMAPFRKILAFGESHGYGGLWMTAAAPAPTSGSASAARRESPGPRGAGPGPGGMAGGGSSPASASTATGDERSRFTAPEAPTTTSLLVSSTSVEAGTAVTFTAEVRAPDGIPDGRVSFVFNDTATRRASLTSSGGAGTASLRIDNLRVGVYDVVVKSPGAGRFRPSASMPARVVVRPGK